MPGAFPPLAGNPVVSGDPKVVSHILLYGLNGIFNVAGKDYNGMMPAWKGTLTNKQIADVLTYIRSSWGNTGAPITEADLAKVAK